MCQVFKKGDLVKVLIGHLMWSYEKDGVKLLDIRPDLVGKEAVIEYSYKERYGKGSENLYSILFIENGKSVSWKKGSELELVKQKA